MDSLSPSLAPSILSSFLWFLHDRVHSLQVQTTTVDTAVRRHQVTTTTLYLSLDVTHDMQYVHTWIHAVVQCTNSSCFRKSPTRVCPYGFWGKKRQDALDPTPPKRPHPSALTGTCIQHIESATQIQTTFNSGCNLFGTSKTFWSDILQNLLATFLQNLLRWITIVYILEEKTINAKRSIEIDSCNATFIRQPGHDQWQKHDA